MDGKPVKSAEILYLRPLRSASAGKTRCLGCNHEFVAYSELSNPIVGCPKCGCGCRVGQK